MKKNIWYNDKIEKRITRNCVSIYYDEIEEKNTLYLIKHNGDIIGFMSTIHNIIKDDKSMKEIIKAFENKEHLWKEKLKEKFPTSVYTVEGLKRLEEFREASGKLLDDYQPIILSCIEKTIPESSAVFINKVRSAAESLIEEQGKGDFELSYTDQELMDLVNSKFIEAVPYQVYNLNMAIKKDGIEVTGDLKLRLLAFGGKCVIRPVARAGRINMEIISAEVAGMKIPDVLVQESTGAVNRAFVTENFPVDIKNIELEDGIIKVEGAI